MKLATTAAILVLTGMALAGCVTGETDDGGTENPTPPTTGEDDLLVNGTVSFVHIGDHGQGNEMQYQVGQAMLEVCEERGGCGFVVTAGDNIYCCGVRSAYDEQFETKFEIPYEDFDIPWYLTLGNHDNGNGGGTNKAAGDYEVEYTYRTDRMSDKWNMPERYYTFQAGDAEFFMIDSGYDQVSYPILYEADSYGEDQAAWLAEAFSQSDAKWKFLVAHHPYRSNGAHGDAGFFDNVAGRGLAYKLMLEDTMCGEAQFMLAGHDHDLQWLEPVDSCGDTEFIVSGGGGAGARSMGAAPHNTAKFEQYNTNGFWWIGINGDTLTAAAYNQDAEMLYEGTYSL